MGVPSSDAVPISDAGDRLTELTESTARGDHEKVLLILGQAALDGLGDVASGRVLDEQDLDAVLTLQR